MRLAIRHPVGSDDVLRHRNPGERQPAARQPFRGRGHDGPVLLRQQLQNRGHPFQNLESFVVPDLQIFNHFEFSVVVGIGLKRAHGFDGAHSVRGPDRFPHVESMTLCPGLPASLDRSQGADQHSIHVKKQPFGSYLDHAASPMANFRPASSSAFSDSRPPLSAYMRNNGSVPEARSNNQLSADCACGLSR